MREKNILNCGLSESFKSIRHVKKTILNLNHVEFEAFAYMKKLKKI